MSSSETPSAVPSPNAATMPSTPMLIPTVVATRNTAIRIRIEISSFDTALPSHLVRSGDERRPHQLRGMPRPLPHPMADLLAA